MARIRVLGSWFCCHLGDLLYLSGNLRILVIQIPDSIEIESDLHETFLIDYVFALFNTKSNYDIWKTYLLHCGEIGKEILGKVIR